MGQVTITATLFAGPEKVTDGFAIVQPFAVPGIEKVTVTFCPAVSVPLEDGLKLTPGKLLDADHFRLLWPVFVRVTLQFQVGA